MRTISGPSPLLLLRTARQLTQAELAQACGVSAASLSNIERGLAAPTPELVHSAAEVLACPVELIEGGEFSVVVADGSVDIKSAEPR